MSTQGPAGGATPVSGSDGSPQTPVATKKKAMMPPQAASTMGPPAAPGPAAVSAPEESSGDEEKGNNVQVMVRIRPQSHLEKEGNHPVVITAPNDEEVKVRQSKKGTTIADKAYTFDNVFNSHSTQEEVFRVAIEPLVSEVLAGFNCTVFAYGQTGTGKTHTMEGTLSADANEKEAGVIPRCVHTIFERLQKTYTEYSVKVSFLELYNEELSDLLTEDDRPLRIFEDTTGRSGMMVNGLEEMLVSSADQVFGLLKRSQQKRRVAETNLNKNSSRSHCVFTITIHGKEASVDGDDVIRTGKLYLVDLAGSECIGRSGAQNQRAKEAGKINQSLLTLGRVITALVEKQAYVPYRDSKLTRLLQESLGGRAKTCIIATVSPSAVCIDESMSTLDYASRAKHIKNKPQVNQKLSKKSYFKDLVGLISRLKAENEALRMKNGVFLPPEQYEELTEGFKSKCSQLEEAEFTLQNKEKELEEYKELFEVKAQELKEVSRQVEEVSMQLEVTKEVLTETKVTLTNTALKLDETEFVVRHQESTEHELANEATALYTTLKQSLRDKDGLFAKIQRKNTVEEKNATALSRFADNHADAAKALTTKLSADLATETAASASFVNELSAMAQETNATASKFESVVLDARTRHACVAAAVATEAQEYAASVATKNEAHNKSVAATISSLVADAESYMNSSAHRIESLVKIVAASDIRSSEIKSVSHQIDAVAQSHKEQMQAIAQETSSFTEQEKKAAETYAEAFGKNSTALTSTIASIEDETIAAKNALSKYVADAAKEHSNATNDMKSFISSSAAKFTTSHSNVVDNTSHFIALSKAMAAKHDAQLASEMSSYRKSIQSASKGAAAAFENIDEHFNVQQQSALDIHEATSAAFSARLSSLRSRHNEEMNAMSAITAARKKAFEAQQANDKALDASLAKLKRDMTDRIESEKAALLQSVSALIMSFAASQLQAVDTAVQSLRDDVSRSIDVRISDEKAADMASTAFSTDASRHAEAEVKAFGGHIQAEEVAYASYAKAAKDHQEEVMAQAQATAAAAVELEKSIAQGEQNCAQRSSDVDVAFTNYSTTQTKLASVLASEYKASVAEANERLVKLEESNNDACQEIEKQVENLRKKEAAASASLRTHVGSMVKASTVETARVTKALTAFDAASNKATTPLIVSIMQSSEQEKDALEKTRTAVLATAERHMQEALELDSETSTSVTKFNKELTSSLRPAIESFVSASTSSASAHEYRTAEKIGALQLSLSSHSDNMKSMIDDNKTRVNAHITAWKAVADAAQKRMEIATEASKKSVTGLSRLAVTLASSDIVPDVPTGTTPVKRDVHFPSTLTRTRPHEAIVDELRQLKVNRATAILSAKAAAAATATATAETPASSGEFSDEEKKSIADGADASSSSDSLSSSSPSSSDEAKSPVLAPAAPVFMTPVPTREDLLAQKVSVGDVVGQLHVAAGAASRGGSDGWKPTSLNSEFSAAITSSASSSAASTNNSNAASASSYSSSVSTSASTSASSCSDVAMMDITSPSSSSVSADPTNETHYVASPVALSASAAAAVAASLIINDDGEGKIHVDVDAASSLPNSAASTPVAEATLQSATTRVTASTSSSSSSGAGPGTGTGAAAKTTVNASTGGSSSASTGSSTASSSSSSILLARKQSVVASSNILRPASAAAASAADKGVKKVDAMSLDVNSASSTSRYPAPSPANGGAFASYSVQNAFEENLQENVVPAPVRRTVSGRAGLMKPSASTTATSKATAVADEVPATRSMAVRRTASAMSTTTSTFGKPKPR